MHFGSNWLPTSKIDTFQRPKKWKCDNLKRRFCETDRFQPQLDQRPPNSRKFSPQPNFSPRNHPLIAIYRSFWLVGFWMPPLRNDSWTKAFWRNFCISDQKQDFKCRPFDPRFCWPWVKRPYFEASRKKPTKKAKNLWKGFKPPVLCWIFGRITTDETTAKFWLWHLLFWPWVYRDATPGRCWFYFKWPIHSGKQPCKHFHPE